MRLKAFDYEYTLNDRSLMNNWVKKTDVWALDRREAVSDAHSVQGDHGVECTLHLEGEEYIRDVRVGLSTLD